MKSVLLGFASTCAIVLSTVAVSLPASAAPITSSTVSISAPTTHVVPFSSTGSLLCTSNGVICLQRVTSVSNGSAYVEVWADTITWTGWLAMYGPDGLISNYPANGVHTFERGGPGRLWDLPVGNGYKVIAWQNQGSPVAIAQINFAVNNG